MSVHALALTSYTKKRVQDCETTVQVANDITKRYPERKILNVPDSSLTIMPKIPMILFPADEVPRPAVIGLGGSHGSYVDSATAIKEILASVLKIPSSIKATLPVNEDLEDSDVEDDSNGGNNDCSDDHNCIQLIPCAQNDIHINRHKASWENTQSESPKSYTVDPLPSSPRVPITSTRGVTELELSPCIKCSNCIELTFSGSTVSQLNLPLSSQKENRLFSTPNLPSHTLNLHFNPNPRDPPSGQLIIPISASVADTEPCSVEDSKTFHRRSQSFSVLEAAGQSLASSTKTRHHSEENLFEPSVNLEKEHRHFLVADMFISVVENMKSNWEYEQWKAEEGIPWIKDPEEPCFYQRKKNNSESAASVDSGYEGLPALQNSPSETIFEEEEVEKEESGPCIDYKVYEYEDFVIIEQEYYPELYMHKQSTRPIPVPGSNSAEQTARNLYRAFQQQWGPVVGEVWPPARSTITTLANDHAIPEEFKSSVSLSEELKQFSERETEDWTPPRFQIISDVHPYIKRDDVVASQNYLCAGCGTKVELRYTNRLRYCDYLGKYFCDCCHSYSESFIPGRILSKWNFSKYYVSNFSKSVVDKIWDSHRFNVQSENPALYSKVKDLARVKEVQQQLIYIKKMVNMCRFADSVVKAFEEVPPHLTEELHLFTLSDLYDIKQRTLLPELRGLLAHCVAHVEECELCQAKGFICEFCQNAAVIFPFQTDICRRCEDCKACYHKQCFKTSDCPKCARIKAREAVKWDSPITSSCEMDLNSST
ncbi:protein associated with UVRAG as autophagy enhancer [Pseudophryne corroboree]|uniref:protein associated with UVRAG as autophagy enhancer n=1 Tax=Pseudophryne corroboree TaxID=495146 RepID=UPI003081A04E